MNSDKPENQTRNTIHKNEYQTDLVFKPRRRAQIGTPSLLCIYYVMGIVKMKIDKSNFTHYASFYGIPCYWNDANGALYGRNLLFDYLVFLFAYLHYYFIAPFDDSGFPIRIIKEIEP